jgi:hypothetical protein
MAETVPSDIEGIDPTAAQLGDPKRFQPLTEGDLVEYGPPVRVRLDPPPTADAEAACRRANWLEWRAASYPAARHSEYLFRSDIDLREGPRIMLSAVMPPPASIEVYAAAYPAKRRLTVTGRRAENSGYTARPIDPAAESEGIWRVVNSREQRQGRNISPMFAARPKDHYFPNYRSTDDPHYRNICTGVFSPSGELAAYLLGLRVGDHVQYDEIMGHADHLKHDVMYFLHLNFLRQCHDEEVVPRCLNYGPWYSGSDPYSPTSGLNFWKRRVGFRPAYLIAASS